MGPAMSDARLSGATPPRLVSPIVERMPTSDWCDDGPRIEFPVSVPSPTVPKLAATAAAVPPLDPAVTRSSAYGFRVYPGRMELTVSNGVKANSARFDLASTMAPAARMRCTMKASCSGTNPCSESEPAVVGRSAVSKLSFTITGMQCSAPVGAPPRRAVSSESATLSARGLTTMIALIAGPCLS